MVRKPDIEYINKYYVHGSEAQVIEFQPNKKNASTTLPKPLRERKTSIVIDPVALCGLVMAVIMLVVMVVGLVDFKGVMDEYRAASTYLQEMKNENLVKYHQYHSSYDLERVEETALALGMIPAEEAATVTISVTVPEVEEEYTWWGDLKWSLSQLFA